MQRNILILAALAAFSAPACSDEEPSPPGDQGLQPPPAGQGLQYKMVSTIQPGQEIERCQFFVAPQEGLNINSETIRYTPGSHHVLLYATSYEAIPTRTTRGVDLDTSKTMDCADGATADWEVTGVVAGSQSSEGQGIVGALPEGVAVTVPGGSVLLMNTHYLNASLSPLEADARINLYTIPSDQVREEAGVLFYYNPFIHIAAGASSTSEMICPVWKDINVIRVQSHMHARGVGFAAELVDNAGTRTEIYNNAHWENVPAKTFEPVLSISAGNSLRYHCNYQNHEDHDIIQGGRTKDEMCMLIGPYYPRDLRLENCLNEQGNFAATWVGSGASTCAETMNCQLAANSQGEFFGCVVDSCRSASAEVTGVTTCLMSDGFGACAAACSDPNRTDCQSCMGTACAPMIDACTIKTCD